MRDDAARALLVDEDLPSLEPSAPRNRTRRLERAGVQETVGSVALDERPARAARPAASRSYGTHRRGEAATTGYQPGRRTVAITGQAAQPRRRPQTRSAVGANPDRVALWAFLLAVFLVLMAVATANAAV